VSKITFRCDDAAGYELTVLQAPDGDFHLGLTPNVQDMKREHGVDVLDDEEGKAWNGMWGASIRVRMPMIGGGSHPELWHALAAMFKALGKAKKLDTTV
jgi:hypothetical protein